jgi:uncharacterized protein (DUF58 family)
MDTDRSYEKLVQDETLIKRRPWYVLAAVLLVLSALTHQSIAFLAALFALVIGLVPELWYRYALRHLVERLALDQRRAFFGEPVTLSISVENQKLLPLPWLEIEDEIPAQVTLLTGHASPSYKVNRARLINAFSLWSFQRVTRRYRLRCLARGVYTFGPATLKSGDPFGWLVREQQVTARETLLVYPLLAPITAFGLPPRRPFGEQATPRRLLEDPLRFAGVREYQITDDPRRIHWKASARVGELRSKIYESSTQYRLLLFLDVATYLEPWMGIDPEIQELTITAAASIAMWGLDEGYAVGLVANSLLLPSDDEPTSQPDGTDPGAAAHSATFLSRVRVPMARDTWQRVRLLSAFGRLFPYLGASIDMLIQAERHSLPMGCTVVLVSAATVLREATIERLLDLRRHGAAVHLALTGDPESRISAATYNIPVHRLGGREVWHELLTHLDDEDPNPGRSATALHLD